MAAEAAVLYRRYQVPARCSAAPQPSSATPQLQLHHWLPAVQPPRASLLILHGYMEHGGRYAALANVLAQQDIECLAPDLRGHGGSFGAPGYLQQFVEYRWDAQSAAEQLHPTAPRFVLGHSNGALVALDFVSATGKPTAAKAPPLRGLCLTNPFLGSRRPASGLKLWVGRLAGKWWPQLSLPAGLKSSDLTHDEAQMQAHANDPAIFKHANAGWYREVCRAQQRLLRQTELPVPLLYVYSDADPVAAPQLSQRFAQQLVCSDKTVLMRAGEFHEVLQESNRHELYMQIGRWMHRLSRPVAG